MEKSMMHLAQITFANLKSGTINPTDDEIISAMNTAIAKEQSMGNQLMASPSKLCAFALIMSGMLKA